MKHLTNGERIVVREIDGDLVRLTRLEASIRATDPEAWDRAFDRAVRDHFEQLEAERRELLDLLERGGE